MYFTDRKEAGQKLLAKLKSLELKDPIILGLPRGGAVVGAEVAVGLKAPLDLLLTRKLGAPFNDELALGAIVEGSPPHMHLNKELCRVLKIKPDYLEDQKQKRLAEIERQKQVYRAGRTRSSVQGKTAIVIDDGAATGASIRAALEALMVEKPLSIVVALPVAPKDVAESLEKELRTRGHLVCLHAPEDFQAVGQFFRDFHQLSDQEVNDVLQRF